MQELTHPYAALLAQLRDFVYKERDIAFARLLETWELPMDQKLEKGLAQRFRGLAPGPEPGTAWASLDGGESRFRQGDQLCLHAGSPLPAPLARQVAFESEEETRWLLRFKDVAQVIAQCGHGRVYAEQEAIDLTPMFEQALREISESAAGRRLILPLLEGQLPFQFNLLDDEFAYMVAKEHGLNDLQAEAVGKAYSATHVACIQGPPGTGKTKVLALAARLMAARGERVLMTSHTHTAINNALGRIVLHGVPTVKVGSLTQTRGLAPQVGRVGYFREWKQRPAGSGYVVGATPFATCSMRLEHCEFDTILFDEASQITVPLALMAMRRGKRFVFIGDQQQLPPVVLSKSILSGPPSVFSRLTAENADSVMLRETYRMNRWLAAWPSRTFYGGALAASGPNAMRTLVLQAPAAGSFAATLLHAGPSAIFVPTLEQRARCRNKADARLVVALCAAAQAGGLPLGQIGIVTPYRAQGRLIRQFLAGQFGWTAARQVVADTVERTGDSVTGHGRPGLPGGRRRVLFPARAAQRVGHPRHDQADHHRP
jgi:DNA replication ATP-dependent helicase Dna2